MWCSRFPEFLSVAHVLVDRCCFARVQLLERSLIIGDLNKRTKIEKQKSKIILYCTELQVHLNGIGTINTIGQIFYYRPFEADGRPFASSDDAVAVLSYCWASRSATTCSGRGQHWIPVASSDYCPACPALTVSCSS